MMVILLNLFLLMCVIIGLAKPPSLFVPWVGGDL